MQRWGIYDFSLILSILFLAFSKGIVQCNPNPHYDIVDSTRVSLTVMVNEKEVNLRFVEGRTIFLRPGTELRMDLESPFHLQVISRLWDKKTKPSYHENIHPHVKQNRHTWIYTISFAATMREGSGFLGFNILGNVFNHGHLIYITVQEGGHWTIPCALNSPLLVPVLYNIQHVQLPDGGYFEAKTRVNGKYDCKKGFAVKNGGNSQDDDVFPSIWQCELQGGIVVPFLSSPPPPPLEGNAAAVGTGNPVLTVGPGNQLVCTSSSDTTLTAKFLKCYSKGLCKLIHACFSEECSSQFYAAPGASCYSCPSLPLNMPPLPAYVECRTEEGEKDHKMLVEGVDGQIYATPIDESPDEFLELEIKEIVCVAQEEFDRCYECRAAQVNVYPHIDWFWTSLTPEAPEKRVNLLEKFWTSGIFVSRVGVKHEADMSEIRCTAYSNTQKWSLTESLRIKPPRVRKPRARQKKPWSTLAVVLFHIFLAVIVVIVFLSLLLCLFKSFEDTWIPPHDQWPNIVALFGIVVLILLVLALGSYLYNTKCACACKILKTCPR